MTPEIHEQYKKLQMAIDLFAPALNMTTMILDLEKFEQEARPFANGTMSIFAAQHMGVLDLRRSEENLKKAIEISRAIRNLLNLININPTAGAADE